LSNATRIAQLEFDRDEALRDGNRLRRHLRDVRSTAISAKAGKANPTDAVNAICAAFEEWGLIGMD